MSRTLAAIAAILHEILVDLFGLGRGGEHALNTIADMNARSTTVAIRVRGVDPNPNALARAAQVAVHRGVEFTPVHARLEHVAEANDPHPMVLLTDDAGADARGLLAAARDERAVLLYLLIRLPTLQLMGLTAVLTKTDAELKVALAAFLGAMGAATVRRGSSAVLGDRGLPEHVFLEPHFRFLFREHLIVNLQKLVWDLSPDADPIEVTFDGETRMPLVIVDSRSAWKEPAALAHEILAQPTVAIAPGMDLCIGEVGPDGLRLHVTRYRALDRRVAVNDSTAVDAAAMEEAIRRAERRTINAKFPVYTTD